MKQPEYIRRFLMELDRLIPGHRMRYMISKTADGQLEIRIGSGDGIPLRLRDR